MVRVLDAIGDQHWRTMRIVEDVAAETEPRQRRLYFIAEIKPHRTGA